MARARSSSKNNSTANLDFEAKLWPAAEARFYKTELTRRSCAKRRTISAKTTTCAGNGAKRHGRPTGARRVSTIRLINAVHSAGGNANFAWVQHFIHHLAPAAPGSS